jgi:hypothetical protein
MIKNVLFYQFRTIIRSCQEINLTSLAKYPEVILGIAGKAHT